MSGEANINVRNVYLILTQFYYFLYRNGLPPINFIQRIFFNKPSTVQKTLASQNSKIDGTEEKHNKKMKELRKTLTKLENKVWGTRLCNIQRSPLKKRNHDTLRSLNKRDLLLSILISSYEFFRETDFRNCNWFLKKY